MVETPTSARPTLSRSGVQRFRPLLLVPIIGIGLLLRLHQIGSEALWIDEAFSLWLVRRPLGGMFHWIKAVDHHPPLYYLLLDGWTILFGASEGGARSLSALLGTLTIPLIYLIGRRLANDRVGLVAALILAVSPFHIRFAQEARMYTLLTLQASAALCTFIRCSPRWGNDDANGDVCTSGPRDFSSSANGAGRSLLSWIGYVLSTTAMLWTHNTAVFFLIAVNVPVLGSVLSRRRLRRSFREEGVPACAIRQCGYAVWLRRWLAAQALVVLFWLPWVPSFSSQAADVARRFWLPAPTLGRVLSIVGALLCDFSPWSLPLAVVVDIGLAALAVLGWRELRHRSAHASLLGSVLVVPFIAQGLVSLWRPILYARTLIWASLPLYLMMAVGVGYVGANDPCGKASRRVCLAVLVALLAINGAALGNYYLTFEKESWDDAAALIYDRAQDEDLILFNGAWGQIPFDYYFGQLYNSHSRSAVLEHGLPVDLFDRGVLEPRMTEQDLARLDRLVDGRRRVWLVYSHQWYTDPDGLIPSALTATLDLIQKWTLKGLQVHLYVQG